MNRFLYLFLLLVIAGCTEKKTAKKNMELHLKDRQNYVEGDTIRCLNPSSFDSVFFVKNQKQIKTFVVDTENSVFGKNEIKIIGYKNNKRIDTTVNYRFLNKKKAKQLNYEIKKIYPHNSNYFTQGLSFFEGGVYESSGRYGKSKLAHYTLGKRTKVNETILPKTIFAEGIHLDKDSIYLLTWKAKKMFVYDLNLKHLTERALPEEINEGWGITGEGEYFILSDGSEYLYFYDKNWDFHKRIFVSENGISYPQLNELDFFRQHILSNVWQKNRILFIAPDSGAIDSYLDLSELRELENSSIVNKPGVLNGVAVLPNGNLLITGKLWSNLYEISVF